MAVTVGFGGIGTGRPVECGTGVRIGFEVVP
jgi:hypothetical protein